MAREQPPFSGTRPSVTHMEATLSKRIDAALDDMAAPI